MEPDAREISSIATKCARKPMSLPPSSPGTVRPSRPIWPSLGHRSCGKTFSSSIFAARGAISASAKRRTVSRSASRSSPNEKTRITTTPEFLFRKSRTGPKPRSGIYNLVTADSTLEARLRTAQRQLELADRADALFGEAVGGRVGRDAVAVADFIDAREVVVDRAHHAHRAFAVVTVDLERHVHHAAVVDRVVGRVNDAALFDFVADLRVGQLVVG